MRKQPTVTVCAGENGSARLHIDCIPPSSVYNRAITELKAFICGKRNFSVMRASHRMSIRIGERYHLLSARSDGLSWQLITHETYNTKCRQKCA
ncbi:TPA: hypothetical protein KEW66_004442 [Escherichia coli]|uniref:ParE family toxin-like protein n=1 Tax=Escherichia coli TaxID=562 RepID=UPI001BA0CC13|nr:hypothetical protein [Escherichia coli]